MEEDKQNTNRADVLHKEDIEMEHRDISQGALVGEFVAHQFVGHEPADKDTRQEAHYRQEQLTCNKVEQIEDSHAKQLMLAHSAQRQRAYCTKQHSGNGHCNCSMFSCRAHFLFQESRAHLMQRNQR